MDFHAHFPATSWLLRKLRSRRFWGCVVLGVAACLISVMTAIRIEQTLFRRNAERFLIAVRQMQVGTTTPAEARQLLQSLAADFDDGWEL